MAVSYSENYLWQTKNCLGRGSFATVYQGRSKRDGSLVAVKHFTIPQSHQEFQVLKKLNHRNIVQFMAYEEELSTRKPIIVMEFCTDGSLLNILGRPENTNGLGEMEFLLLLGDLSGALKYLRENHIVHRDIKPGNIMRTTKVDGKSLYKLVDFGAARKLEDNESFLSLYGTEEYLRPDLYERAIRKIDNGMTFKADTDLWSIGVTLYHAAAGNVPFRPYAGRKNRDVMYHIITNKQNGHISGVQSKENGPIVYSSELPDACLFNGNFRSIVTPLIADLMENDTTKLMSYDDFFSRVSCILMKKKVCIFVTNEMKNYIIYLNPDYTRTDVINAIKYNIDDYLLTENRRVAHQFLVHNIKDYHVEAQSNLPVNHTRYLGFKKGITRDGDPESIRNSYQIAFKCKRLIDHVSNLCMLLCDSVEEFCSYLKNQIVLLHMHIKHLKQVAKFVDRTDDYRKIIERLSAIKSQILFGVKDELSTVDTSFLYQSQCMDNKLLVDWKTMTKDLTAQCTIIPSTQVNSYINHVDKSCNNIRNNLNVSFDCDQIHSNEQKYITTNVNNIIQTSEDLKTNWAKCTEKYAEWYMKAQSVYVQIQILGSSFTKYYLKLDDLSNEIKWDVEEIKKQICDKTMKKSLRNLLNTKQDMNIEDILKENKKLTDELSLLNLDVVND